MKVIFVEVERAVVADIQVADDAAVLIQFIAAGYKFSIQFGPFRFHPIADFTHNGMTQSHVVIFHIPNYVSI